jgi:hypothetical protein
VLAVLKGIPNYWNGFLLLIIYLCGFKFFLEVPGEKLICDFSKILLACWQILFVTRVQGVNQKEHDAAVKASSKLSQQLECVKDQHSVELKQNSVCLHNQPACRQSVRSTLQD